MGTIASEPQEQHRWLERLTGEWIVTGDAPPDAPPGAPPPEWTETVRSLHGLWIVGVSRGDMPGCGPVEMQITLGYDPRRERFVGTWIGSMMTHLWVYEGTLDPDGRVLTLESEGPHFDDPGRTGRYRDVITVEDDDHRTMTGQRLTDAGAWETFVTFRFRRKTG
ncbi:DUF1579 domain-containing protein [Azospirillum halopraeferens]|uniref:DUF1579 domain-containing protein n=1 Tax=Azospirillum halopraeferens TaxID=34010 RepID=UPI0003FCF25C|nr:DUF1579 domain-containing protein [Azospirillum halopraeferens]